MTRGAGAAQDYALIYDATARRWLRFAQPVKTYLATSPETVLACMSEIEQRLLTRRFWAAGFLSYESSPAFDAALTVRLPASFPCLWFGVYEEPEVVCPAFDTADMSPIDWAASVSTDQYRACIRRIKEHIAAGDTYQVNYTFRLHGSFDGDPWTLFSQMVPSHQPGYAAYVRAGRWLICSASPELFWAGQNGCLWSRPMKGTASRGLWFEDDVAKANWLRQSQKNQAENLMIVDMVRNDLGRIAVGGSVSVTRLFEVERHPTVWQMTSTVEAQAAASLTDTFRALFPAASITGAPKVKTVSIINRLETTPRRIYTGTIGFVAPDSRAQFNVAIRTLLFDTEERRAEYGVGGGIVWDSEEDSEYEECLVKARTLTQAGSEFQLLETMLWTPEDGYFLRERHLVRLSESGTYFSYPINVDVIRDRLETQASCFGSHPQKVRLLVSSSGQIAIESAPFVPSGAETRVCLSRNPVDSRDRFLYHKTTHRAVYEKALRDCPGFGDVLLWNERGEITESTVANVVFKMGQRLFTPPVSSGLLPGTYRALLLDEGKISEKILRLDELRMCSGIYLINSVRKMRKTALD
ncbi:MAG: aminodeoxychorismate synthase component I [Acidobacteria bacterium]|nr:MAG: aminodeoxychorismate synthase component I [Acidobacteriota bacterium]